MKYNKYTPKNNGKRWEEREFLLLILMYIVGVHQYTKMCNPKANFPTLRRLYNPKSKLQEDILKYFFLQNRFGEVLCKLRSKDAILTKLSYRRGYYCPVTYWHHPIPRNKSATTRFKTVSRILFDKKNFPIDAIELAVRGTYISKGKYISEASTLLNKAYYNLGSLWSKDIITTNDYFHITKALKEKY